MTDDPGLTPQQDAVRRLLADARHDGPTPPEVVDRLDAALASLVSELVTERGGPALAGAAGQPAPVVDLGARRRRTAGIGLLAAAAVVVAGVAIGQGLPRTSSGDDAGAGSEMSTAQERELTEDDSGADAGGGLAEAPQSLKSAAPDAAHPTLSTTDPGLDEDLLDLRATETLRSAGTGSARTPADCDLGGVGQGRRVAAQVDGLSGVVLFRRPDGAAQRVELYVCGSPAPVRTLTLPAP